jgi:undecaprenyl-diphosphatase
LSLEQIFILAIIQGLTEFLPISSTAHLNLLHLLTRWPDQGVLIDAAVHVGSLFAVLVYFRRDVGRLATGSFGLVTGRDNHDGRLAVYLIFATIPLIIFAGLLVLTGLIEFLRTLKIIAWANILFALLLWFADRWGALLRRLPEAGFLDAMMVGLAQAFALVPGASRAGVTISMARALGFERTEAAKFSMLMSIPAIFAVGAGATMELQAQGKLSLTGDAVVAASLSFCAAFLSIWFMMALLKRMSLLPFILYRLILGTALLAWIYTR